ncbi:nucleotide exchange factor GrpE [uncultured Eubacterium sp.]|uniref:nucleotide exchange factor GrpE n=1 Tax=uncultured Eubacterium sp. TaxID=165185 RepID=UPI0015B29856|nr:nucleotide exchange factor GrpE [uncultured Eubacterium sp.]
MSKKEKKEEELIEEETVQSADEVEVEEPKEPTLEDQLADMKKQLAYTAAEYANFRARSAKEKEQTYSNAKGNVVAEILPIIDNLERALSQEGEDFEALKKGVQMTMDQLMQALTKIGVEAYGESGDTFDPNFHNAVMHIEDDDLGENVITDVFQKGYKINDRVIRPAMVKTAN